MRSSIYVAVSAFAALVAAQTDNPFNVPSGGYDFTSGEPTTIKWTPTTDSTVTLKLQVGTNIRPDSGEIIAENIPNSGSYSFVPPSDVEPNTEYTVEIIDDSDPENYNFTPKFTIDDSSPDSSATASDEITATTETGASTITDATTTGGTTAAATEATTDATASTETGTDTVTSDVTSPTTMATSGTASGTETESETASETASGTQTESESSTGTSTADPTVQSTTAPGSGVSLKVHGGMFALVAGVMAAL